MDSLNYENLEETCQNITDTMIDRINHLHEQGANDEAIALWPKLEELGVPLGSPVPAETQGTWLEKFMQKANENNLRVDFIALHIYQSNNPQLFLDIVDIPYELCFSL